MIVPVGFTSESNGTHIRLTAPHSDSLAGSHCLIAEQHDDGVDLQARDCFSISDSEPQHRSQRKCKVLLCAQRIIQI